MDADALPLTVQCQLVANLAQAMGPVKVVVLKTMRQLQPLNDIKIFGGGKPQRQQAYQLDMIG
jgi:hypothetical protein